MKTTHTHKHKQTSMGRNYIKIKQTNDDLFFILSIDNLSLNEKKISTVVHMICTLFIHSFHFISIHRKDDFLLNQIFFRIISSYSVNWVATRKNVNWIERKKERKFLFWVFFDWLYINWLVVAQCTIITHPSINPWFVGWGFLLSISIMMMKKQSRMYKLIINNIRLFVTVD